MTIILEEHSTTRSNGIPYITEYYYNKYVPLSLWTILSPFLLLRSVGAYRCVVWSCRAMCMLLTTPHNPDTTHTTLHKHSTTHTQPSTLRTGYYDASCVLCVSFAFFAYCSVASCMQLPTIHNPIPSTLLLWVPILCVLCACIMRALRVYLVADR